jgi:hypothetical protein
MTKSKREDALAALNQGDFQQAAVILRGLLDNTPADADLQLPPRFDLAFAERELGRFDQSEESFFISLGLAKSTRGERSLDVVNILIISQYVSCALHSGGSIAKGRDSCKCLHPDPTRNLRSESSRYSDEPQSSRDNRVQKGRSFEFTRYA